MTAQEIVEDVDHYSRAMNMEVLSAIASGVENVINFDFSHLDGGHDDFIHHVNHSLYEKSSRVLNFIRNEQAKEALSNNHLSLVQALQTKIHNIVVEHGNNAAEEFLTDNFSTIINEHKENVLNNFQ
jgi:hypothetical protein